MDHLSLLRNWASESRANHLLAAPSPADVLLRFVNRDGQVVPTAVSTRRGARRTSCNPIPPGFSPHLEVVQDVKLPLLCRVLPPWCRRDLTLLRLAPLSQLLEQGAQALLGKLRHPFEECQLIVETVVGAVEPKPRTDCAVNSQRPAEGIAEVAILQFVVFREYLDSLGGPRSLHRDTELLGQAGDQEAALSGQERLLPEDPQVRAAPALLQCRFHLLLLQFPLQLAEVFERLLVVAVHGNPFAALGRRIHRVYAERQITLKMPADRRCR